VGSNPSPEDSRVLFAQLVEERNLLKHQIALLEEKLAQQNETLTAVYRERDEFRERFRREQRQSNQLKRALESVVERAAETRPVAPAIHFAPPLAPRTDGEPGEPAAPHEGWPPPRLEDRSADTKPPSPVERSPQSDVADPAKALAPEPHSPAADAVPSNVVLLRPLAEPMPLSPAATRILQSQTEPSRESAQPPPDLGIQAEAIAETVSPEVAPPLPEAAPVPAPEPAQTVAPSRPRPMLPAFASRSQPVGAKFLNENPPPERETSRRRTERPEVDCSERPERPVGGQVAPPSFWQDLQKGTPPKGTPPPPRKRVTAFAAIQLPDFPPLR
jgi:hypothetical protein